MVNRRPTTDVQQPTSGSDVQRGVCGRTCHGSFSGTKCLAFAPASAVEFAFQSLDTTTNGSTSLGVYLVMATPIYRDNKGNQVYKYYMFYVGGGVKKCKNANVVVSWFQKGPVTNLKKSMTRYVYLEAFTCFHERWAEIPTMATRVGSL